MCSHPPVRRRSRRATGRSKPCDTAVAREGNAPCNPYATPPCWEAGGRSRKRHQWAERKPLHAGQSKEMTRAAGNSGLWIAPRRSAVRVRLAASLEQTGEALLGLSCRSPAAPQAEDCRALLDSAPLALPVLAQHLARGSRRW